MAELLHDARGGIGEQVDAVALALEADGEVVGGREGLRVLGPVGDALVKVGMQALGQVGLRVAAHGLVRDGARVQERPHRGSKERALQQRRVLRRVREQAREVRPVEVHEHAAHVEDDVADGLGRGLGHGASSVAGACGEYSAAGEACDRVD